LNFEEKRKHYRREFPVVETEIYLNHAGHGPWSVSSVKAMESFMKSFAYGPMLHYDFWDEEQDTTRRLMAQLLGAAFEEIAFNFNTSLSLFMFTHSMAWEPGDNIIVPDRCFPSIVQPAKLLRQQGVEGRVVETVDGLISIDKLAGAIDGRTRMMIVPLVNFLTGQRLDIARLSRACRDSGVFLVVDAIQAVGPIKVDVKALGCHALCFGSPKWMFGPMGVGTIYIDLEEIEKLRVAQMGMLSVPDAWNFFDYDQPLVPQCRRFECGCQAHLAHFGINPNIRMFLDLGPENTERYLLELTGYLHDELTGNGIDVITPRADSERAAIVTFSAESAGWDDADLLLKTLDESSIRVAVRMGMVRVSPHFYNNREEIDRFLDAVFRR